MHSLISDRFLKRFTGGSRHRSRRANLREEILLETGIKKIEKPDCSGMEDALGESEGEMGNSREIYPGDQQAISSQSDLKKTNGSDR